MVMMVMARMNDRDLTPFDSGLVALTYPVDETPVDDSDVHFCLRVGRWKMNHIETRNPMVLYLFQY